MNVKNFRTVKGMTQEELAKYHLEQYKFGKKRI